MIVVKQIHGNQQARRTSDSREVDGRAVGPSTAASSRPGRLARSRRRSSSSSGIAGAFLFGAAVIAEQQSLVANDPQRRAAVSAVGHRGLSAK